MTRNDPTTEPRQSGCFEYIGSSICPIGSNLSPGLTATCPDITRPLLSCRNQHKNNHSCASEALFTQHRYYMLHNRASSRICCIRATCSVQSEEYNIVPQKAHSRVICCNPICSSNHLRRDLSFSR